VDDRVNSASVLPKKKCSLLIYAQEGAGLAQEFLKALDVRAELTAGARGSVNVDCVARAQDTQPGAFGSSAICLPKIMT
jgi:hypothetical protein